MENRKALRKVNFLDVQWSDCSEAMVEQVQNLWRLMELGNDRYIHRTTIAELEETESDPPECRVWVEAVPDVLNATNDWGWQPAPLRVNLIIDYLKAEGLEDNEEVLIHYWW